MYPSEIWIAYVDTDGNVIVEDRRAVGHVTPVCYDRQLSQQLSGNVSNGGKTLTASWTRPLTVPTDFAGLGYLDIASGATVPLITALHYDGPAVPAGVPCSPALAVHEVAWGGISGLLAGGGEERSASAEAAPASASRICSARVQKSPRPFPASGADAVAVAERRAAHDLPLHTAAAANFSGVVGTFAICAQSVTVIGQIDASSGSIDYLGQGTGDTAPQLIDGFNSAVDPVGRVLYALAINEGRVESVTLYGFSVDSGGALSS